MVVTLILAEHSEDIRDEDGDLDIGRAEDVVKEYLATHDNLVQSSGQNGSGSHIATPGGTGAGAVDKTSKEYIRAHLAAARRQMGRE
jgi:hypothetical protein